MKNSIKHLKRFANTNSRKGLLMYNTAYYNEEYNMIFSSNGQVALGIKNPYMIKKDFCIDLNSLLIAKRLTPNFNHIMSMEFDFSCGYLLGRLDKSVIKDLKFNDKEVTKIRFVDNEMLFVGEDDYIYYNTLSNDRTIKKEVTTFNIYTKYLIYVLEVLIDSKKDTEQIPVTIFLNIDKNILKIETKDLVIFVGGR